jgi:hypothetical protein
MSLFPPQQVTAEEIARAAAEEERIRQSAHTKVTRMYRSHEEEMSSAERSSATTTSTLATTAAAGGGRGAFGAIKEMVEGRGEGGRQLHVEQGYKRGYEAEKARDSSTAYGIGANTATAATAGATAGTGGGMMAKAKEMLVDRPVEAVKVRVEEEKKRWGQFSLALCLLLTVVLFH